MAKDFAKGKQSASRRQAPRRKKSRDSGSGRGWKLYGAGVLTGVFLSFLAYLGTLPQPGDSPAEQAAAPSPEPAPKPRFDFYTLLPEQEIDVDVEPAEVEPARDIGNPPPSSAGGEVYILQAGSFRQREDADRRRAELLLLGLEPSIQEGDGDNGRWYRVYLGPFETRSGMNRARGLTAAQDIDTLLLKRNRP